ncbi:hypothetical protein AAZV13_14G068100 [Glycine max]
MQALLFSENWYGNNFLGFRKKIFQFSATDYNFFQYYQSPPMCKETRSRIRVLDAPLSILIKLYVSICSLASNCAEEASSWCASTTTKGSCFGSNIVSNTQLLSKHGKKNALRGNDASMLIG